MVGEGGGSSSPLYSFLRSSENRFLLRVLVEDRPLVGDGGGNGLPRDDGAAFASSRGSLGFVTDIELVKKEEMKRGWMSGVETKKRVGGTLEILRLYIFSRVLPLSRTDLGHLATLSSMAEARDRLVEGDFRLVPWRSTV